MKKLTRRDTLELLGASGAGLLVGCTPERAPTEPRGAEPPRPRAGASAVLEVEPLRSGQWQTSDPFLFCAHHLDDYPRGNQVMGPAASLSGHRMGSDFAGVDGWRMYHGEQVPGFPRHPHRGFETVTVVRTGLLDHSDSLGATARYGNGDVQWLTAGGGIQHAEMFPLLQPSQPNPFELFQIWLNLPAANKMVRPHFSMLWQPTIPSFDVADVAGRSTRVTVVAGRYQSRQAPAPPPASWASETDSHVAIWTLDVSASASFTLPAAPRGTNRSLYFYRGTELNVGGRPIASGHRVLLRPDEEIVLSARGTKAELLLLQGKPIGEPVARHGPFVMNSEAEIRQAYSDYRRTQFGGWPWPSTEPVHPRRQDRFALRPDGEIETPG